MSIDNLLLISTILLNVMIAVSAITALVLYISKNKKPKETSPIIEIEKLPNDHKGFGYIRGKSLVLNEHGIPYLYKTYNMAKSRMKRVRGVDRIVFQQWDIDTQTVLVAEVKRGSN